MTFLLFLDIGKEMTVSIQDDIILAEFVESRLIIWRFSV